MSFEGKILVLGIFIGLFIGIGATFFYRKSVESRALSQVAVESSEVTGKLFETIRILELSNQQQEDKIEELSDVLGRISSVVSEEVDSVQKAWGIIQRLKELVVSLP